VTWGAGWQVHILPCVIIIIPYIGVFSALLRSFVVLLVVPRNGYESRAEGGAWGTFQGLSTML
jgi:hypothetical protein